MAFNIATPELFYDHACSSFVTYWPQIVTKTEMNNRHPIFQIFCFIFQRQIDKNGGVKIMFLYFYYNRA